MKRREKRGDLRIWSPELSDILHGIEHLLKPFEKERWCWILRKAVCVAHKLGEAYIGEGALAICSTHSRNRELQE